MKKLSLFTAFLVVLLLNVQSQSFQNAIWSLPPNYVKFIGSPSAPIPLPAPGGTHPYNPLNTPNYTGTPALYNHNAMQDANGDLLFFIVDSKIYDKNGEAYAVNEMQIFSGYGYGFTVSGFAETMIVPDPGNCQRYYIFSVRPEGGNGGGAGCPDCKGLLTLHADYSILNLENLYDPDEPLLAGLINGLEEFPSGQVESGLPKPAGFNHISSEYVQFASTDLNDNNERFIYVAEESNLYRYKLTASGLFFDGQFGDFTNITGGAIRSEMELLKLPNGNYRLAVPIIEHKISPTTDVYDEIAIFEINPLTGDYLPGSKEILVYDTYTGAEPLNTFFHSSVTIKGLEFSPDGNYLYITRTRTSQFPNAMDVYTVGSGLQPANIPGLNLPNFNDFKFSQIELGKDGKLYFATSNRLATYSDPNNPFGNPAVQWNDNAVTLPNTYSLLNFWPLAMGVNENYLLYPLPDQIDGMNYADHFTVNTECCLANTAFSTTIYNHVQEGVQNWTTTNNAFGNAQTITVKDELIIKTGANITANNLRFEFATDAKLVIEQGATFTANNCTFTVETTCENSPMWNGIEVFGPTNGQQTTAGKLIANNSLIEHAYMATHNFKTVKSGTPGTFWEDYGYRGGVIIATNSTFRNNHRGTVFFDFQNKNASNQFIDDQSKFNNSTFVTDAPLNKPTLTPTVIMAHLFGVQSVNFYGCDFKTTTTDPSIAPHQRGSGIEASNCLLTVSSLTTGLSTDRSTFTDMTRGIDAYSSLSSSRTTRIRNTDFNNVWRGIYLKSNNLAMVLNNTFDVASDNAWGHSYGLYLDFCNRYKVENNAFNTTHNGFIGTYTYQSLGNNNNEIYKNTFNNLVIGSQAAGINGNGSSTNGGLGLVYRCNTYTNTGNADIYVSSGKVKPFHGDCIPAKAASNNKFSYTALYGDFLQAPAPAVVDYVSYQYNIGANLAPRDGYFNIINTDPTQCITIYDAATQCPVHVNKSFVVLNDEYAASKQQVATLTAQIDDNNTQGLLTILQSQSPGNVKNALMAASPYLSDEVLLTYLTTNAPNGHLQQVLLANSPLSGEVMDAVKQLNLPKGIKTQITNAQTGISAMQELQTEIAYYKTEVDQIKSDILRYFLFDDAVEERLKEALEFLNQGTCTQKQCELVEFYTANKEYAKATQELSTLTDNIEDADFVKLFTNIIALEQTANPTQELVTNASIQQPIIEVAEATNRKQETARAEVMLKQSKLRNYQETIEELNIGGSGLRLMNQEEKQSAISNLQSAITVYPNPTSNEVNITHNLNLENGKVTFKVYNMLGVEVLNENLTSANNEVKVNTLKAGVYFYAITQNNQTIKTDKLMVK